MMARALVFGLALSLAIASPGRAQTPPAPSVSVPAGPSGNPVRNLADEALLPVRPGNRPAQLTATEAEAMFHALQLAKPNLSNAAVVGFLFPGAAQAMMGALDHTFWLWGPYLAGFTAAKLFIPDANLVAGQRLNDLLVGGMFMAMASASALDAYLVAQGRRQAYDRLQDRLIEGQAPVLPRGLAP